ncbi:microfibril-associated glycoprotein 4-like [Ruditapes philippinarum]|uniref:microfibril-associated glycoprotein 4-like n=1 Tax=Ruditapes philippinarum TaxID=129788 RepID=UPI00295AA676|nr:microfibril-associated glycoprotein 4-like [Ruditapes philippinarum]
MLLIFVIIHSFGTVQSLGNEFATSFFEIEKVFQFPKNDPSLFLIQAKSLISCSFHCQKLNSPSFYYFENNATCFCCSGHDNYTGEEGQTDNEIIHGKRTETVSTTYTQVGSLKTKRIHKQPEPIDCLELFQQGYTEDGVYVIKPTGSSTTDVWCDMTNGGWTVIQRRQDGSEDFYRNWEEYKQGFGNRSGEYWLGLENIHHFTKSNSSLNIYMETFQKDNMNPFSAFAEYSIFKINDESDKYRLTVGGYHGSCGDSMSPHNNCQFSTKDNDNDDRTGNCAQDYGGAWWYRSCHTANLNGLYLNGVNTENSRGINWYYCWGFYYSLKNVVMKMRRDM